MLYSDLLWGTFQHTPDAEGFYLELSGFNVRLALHPNLVLRLRVDGSMCSQITYGVSEIKHMDNSTLTTRYHT